MVAIIGSLVSCRASSLCPLAGSLQLCRTSWPPSEVPAAKLATEIVNGRLAMPAIIGSLPGRTSWPRSSPRKS
eukprot:1304780-Heterocapsa_arctica.AAC.1